MRSREEHNAQVLGVKLCRLRWPILNRLMWAIPNGGDRDVRIGAMLKAEGVTAGVWDIMVAVSYWEKHIWDESEPDESYARMIPGLIIEMKSSSAIRRKNHGLTVEQVEFCEAMMSQGWNTEVCSSANEMVSAVERHMKAAGY